MTPASTGSHRRVRRLAWFATAGLAMAALLAPSGAVPVLALTGAVYTSNIDGSIINENVGYPSKADVYLTGGPCNGGSHLAAGDYYFEISSPNGILLSSDAIGDRKFSVADDFIQSTTSHGTHPVLCDPAVTGVTVQLIPFDDTPNAGGEYKLTIATAETVEACVDFAPDSTTFEICTGADQKSDNFKVGEVEPTPTPTPVEPTPTPAEPTPTASPTEPPVEPTFSVLTAEPVCDGDAPFLDYEVEVEGSDADTVTIVFLHPSDPGQDVIHEDLPLAGSVPWPGSEFDEDGFPSDWPGWRFEDGVWVEGDEYDWVRPSVDVLFSVNPEAVVTVDYPASAPQCNPGPPEGEVGGATGTPGVTLPPTDLVTGEASGPTGEGWRLVLLTMAGLLGAALLLTPAAAVVRGVDRD